MGRATQSRRSVSLYDISEDLVVMGFAIVPSLQVLIICSRQNEIRSNLGPSAYRVFQNQEISRTNRIFVGYEKVWPAGNGRCSRGNRSSNSTPVLLGACVTVQ